MLTLETLYIGGSWTSPSSDDTIVVTSPNTGDTIGRVPGAGRPEVDAAVAAARQAFDDPQGWSRWEPSRRAFALEAFAAALEKRHEPIAERVSQQNGMPITASREGEAGTGPALLRYYAELIRAEEVDDLRISRETKSLVVGDADGVVAAIVPWNYPQALAFTKVAPALAVGCTVVLKPSPEAVLDSFLVAEALDEAGLPPGVLNIVPGGRETGAYLVGHPGVDHVAFTGSTAAGRLVGEQCGALLRPVTLELGGKSAAIILEDADLGSRLDAFFVATMANNGQTCHISTRILVPAARQVELVDLISDFVASVRVGDSMAEATQVGPLVSERQRARALDLIRAGVTQGARLTTGGGIPADRPQGWFIEPTVFADVDNGSRIAREEVFGPVLAIMAYDDLDDAVALANDSDYGLAGSVWTEDLDRGIGVARRMVTGGVGINGTPMDIYSPFGGVKSSGIGRELGPEGLRTFRQAKSIYLPFQ